ncbi:MAG TPA: CDP-alcohol phosphatidyltransferase family protein [Methylomirabilota bacterium]
MIRQAALYLATDDDLRAARLCVAGRPVAFRAMLAAVRAGALRVAAPAALRSPDLEAALATSPSVRAALVWLDTTGALAPEPTLVLPAAGLAPAPALARLLREPPGRVLAESWPAEAPVLTVDSPMLARLEASLLAGAPLGETLAREVTAGALAATSGERWFVRVTGEREAAEAEARLWSELGSPIDTRLDVAVHRRLSRNVTRAAVALGIAPNPITVASGVVGLAAAAVIARGEPAALLAGLLLYLVAVVLDHADGEVARLTLTESAIGEWLDITVDTVVHAALVLALGVAADRVTGLGLSAGVVAAVGVVASATVAKRWPPAPPTARERGLLDPLTSRDGFYLMLVVFIAVRLVVPAWLPALMFVVAVGTHAYWLARAALSIRPAPSAGTRS